MVVRPQFGTGLRLHLLKQDGLRFHKPVHLKIWAAAPARAVVMLCMKKCGMCEDASMVLGSPCPKPVDNLGKSMSDNCSYMREAR